MYFKILLNYILGYVQIEIEGYYIERFINFCHQQKIFLWNFKKKTEAAATFNVSIQDFRRIKPIAKKSRCKVKIGNKKGLPFLFYRYQKRKIFFLCLFLIMIAIFTLSHFIWNIEITGNETIDKAEIEKILQENNFKIGKSKIGLNTKEVINQIRLQRNDIAWVGIEIKGTNATVKIVEANLKPDIIQEDDYCNIVATKEGRITKISAGNGTPVVKEGEVITKGSILIGGWLEGKFTGTRYVHANGEVWAKVWYTATAQVPFKQLKKEQTGNVENKYSVKINNFQINFFKTLSKFQKYDTIETSKKLKLFSNLYLPIEITQKRNEEYTEIEVTYSKDEAKQMAIEEAKQKIEGQIKQKENILGEQIHEKQTEQYIEVEVIYEVLENIATKEKIVF
ncbi:MAG: sporulation protein YqfD [Clostridia bacterium]|nr:sporulation protein YqfD [Clostridia bacterium]